MKFPASSAWCGLFAVITLIAMAPCHGAAGQSSTNAVNVDPNFAASYIQKEMGNLMRPVPWQGREPKPDEVADFQKEMKEKARALVVLARELLRRFPTNEYSGDLRFAVVFALNHALAAGDTAAGQEARDFIDATLKDPVIDEDAKAGFLTLAGSIAFMKQAGMRYFTEGRQSFSQEMDPAMVETLLEAKQRFPTNEFLFKALIAFADRSQPAVQKRLADEVLNSPGARPGAKAFAQRLKDGARPYRMGQPIDLSFTALDGREVDLAKMKGKVVLVEFLATDCAPCAAEMPQVRAVYDKYHAAGFEVIVINMDEKDQPMVLFPAVKDLRWPEYFDGKGWANRFAVQYGIFSIPTMWVLDKQGNLRDFNARGHLESAVVNLLREETHRAVERSLPVFR